jgi:hypothetical protein
MAARQDQGLQIALIILIFLFILTAVAAYIGWKSYGDSEQRGAAQQSQLNEKNTQVNNLQADNEKLRTWIGVQPNDNMPDVEATYTADMKRMEAYEPDEQRRFYRTVLQSVYEELQETAGREAEAKDQVKQLETKLLAVNNESEKQYEEYQTNLNKAKEDLANERKSFAEDRAKLETTKGELLTNLDKQRDDYEAKITERDKKITDFERQVAELERNVRDLRTQVPTDDESFEVADGRISWVNQNGTVWINIGEADSLRRQVTFNVYDADEHDAARAERKGSIEVTRLLGDHMAEARVTEDDPTNPILSGDNIYSPVWDRGRKLRFAITGLVDVDGDGVSDMKLVRELIELNGGAVDAYLGDDGKVVGSITAYTRYMVDGEIPESAANVKLQTGRQEMKQMASDLGIESITLDEFLDKMGYTGQDRTVPLGEAASARVFPARVGDGTELPEIETGGESTELFRPRTPYGTSRKTAY